MAYQVRAGLAVAQFFSGRTEAIDDMKRALANAEAIGDDYTVASVAAALGEAYTSWATKEPKSISAPPWITTVATTCGPTWRAPCNRWSIGTSSRTAARRQNRHAQRPAD